jgi:hypothetical protein
MEEFDKIIWGFGLSIMGTAFGWILNEASHWLRTSREEKKVLKKVIYNLLETLHIFSRADIEKEVKYLSEKTHGKLGAGEQQKLPKQLLETMYLNLIEQLNSTELKNDVKKIEGNYHSAIDELSMIDPITAYYLSGKTEIFDRFDRFDEFMNSAKQDIQNQINEPVEINNKELLRFFRPEILNETKEILEEEILNLSKKVNWIYWFKMKKTVKKIKKKADEGFKEKIDEIIGKLEQMMK